MSSQKPPIMTKTDFLALHPTKENSDLFFYSGGSSGDPKISIFTYEDYHRQMELAAEGLFAAGLDPKKDLAMNLFFAGGLYGGFLSFFTILEKLQCPHFPMAAHTDHQFVAKTIVKHKVNTLLGMPSYLLQLFHDNESLFRNNRVVQKIFYGGEHFSQSQKKYFQENFGIETIRSATYGSVDAGPLGFQCDHSTGAIHHLHYRLHDLEIVQLDKDEPVEAGQVGRFLITSKVRKGQKIVRYEIGDVGRWVPEPCPCGRKHPRFELLGRTGDIFRIGANFMSYQSFNKVLSEDFDYSGAFQIHLYPAQGLQKEKLSFRVDENLLPNSEKESLLQKFMKLKDFKETVTVDKTVDIDFQFIPSHQFQITKGSGKIKGVIDHRLGEG